MADSPLNNPILHSPFDAPDRHFVLGPDGPTGEIATGRRPSTSWVPVPPQRKGKAAAEAVQGALVEQTSLELAGTNERVETNTLINDIRQRLELWRVNNYSGATPTSRKLLEHWAADVPVRENPVWWCQREAAETAIYLAELAGRKGEPDFRRRIEAHNTAHNDGLPRVALKMATGTGKTVVMAMLIAWQTLNKAASPKDGRFTNRFLVITPGITIRDRLRVLQPSDTENYYDLRDLVPPDLRPRLGEARVHIVNYHTFLPRTAKELAGVSATTRKILTGGADPKSDQFVETEAEIVARVTAPLTGRGGRARGRAGEIMVFSDEAHHCYQDKLVTGDNTLAQPDRDDKRRNEDARVWFRGIAAIHRHLGVKTAYDLSATPFYLKGSGYNEGFIFPWTVSDFGLMEAIESGIVKIPRIPVDDDAAGDQVTYLHLWDHVGKALPKRLPKDADTSAWKIPVELEGALRSLHRSYAGSLDHWERELASLGEPPPVMIVVCPNTTVSRLVHDWIAGHDDRPGHLELLSNVADGVTLARPRTVLIDSAALDSGDTLGKDFKRAMATEIDTFKAEIRRRSPGADAEALTDEDLLREVMNTIGKPGRLGEQIRCVVSVSMLTEGWDANTVTHILGIRAFGSQLLCEQVVGRGLRRRGFALDENRRFSPEYAQIYGVPFAFIPGEGGAPPGDPKPAQPAVHVHAVDERAELEITFPVLDGYRMEVPDELFFEAFDDPADRLHVQRDALATWVQSAGVIGADDEVELTELRELRPASLAYKIAAQLLDRFERDLDDDGARRPWLFPELLGITKRWIDECVTVDPDAFIGLLDTAQGRTLATERVYRAIVRQEGNRHGVLRPMIHTFDPQRSTAAVNFVTRKKVIAATKSHVNVVTLDSAGGAEPGNTWEEAVAGLCEHDDRVAAFVKNDGLGLRIPYLHKGRSRNYVPDFLVRLAPTGADDAQARTLIVEVSGSRKSPGSTRAKAATARDQWCVAVNNHGGWGRWGYVELGDPEVFGRDLGAAIETLYANEPAADPAGRMTTGQVS